MLMTTNMANSVMAKLKTDLEPAKFSPMLIIAVIELIVKAVQFYKECPIKLGNAKHMFNSGGVLVQARLERHAAQILRRHKMDPSLNTSIVDAAKARLAELSDDDVQIIIDENAHHS